MRLENNRIAAQRSRQRKKNALDDLDQKVAKLTRIQDELVEKNQRLLREKRERQKKLKHIKIHQDRLSKAVWIRFMACKVATEELKKRICPNRDAATPKTRTIPGRPFQAQMQAQYPKLQE